MQIRSRRVRNVTLPNGQPGVEVDVEGTRAEGYTPRTIKLGLNEPVRRVDKRATARRKTEAAGHDVTPGHDELHHYWTKGEGLAKWAESPKPWTTLVAHLTKYVGPEKAKIYASRWFIEHFHFAAGSDKNRVAHGHPPRGHLVGPG